MRSDCVAALVAVARPAPRVVGEEDPGQPVRQLLRDLQEIQHAARTGGAFHLQLVVVEVVPAFERLHQQIVEREPDRAAPIGVAAEQRSRALGGGIVDTILLAPGPEHTGPGRNESQAVPAAEESSRTVPHWRSERYGPQRFQLSRR
jgi:hypothetical protein